MDNFKKAVSRYTSLSDESWNELLTISQLKFYKKGDFILRHNEVCKGFYFISKGLLRIYYFKEEKEISEWFAFEDEFCFSIISFFKHSPSHLAIQCLEDSEIITISREGLDLLRSKNFEIANFVYLLISGSLIASQERMQSIQFETALQRYENLLKLHPSMLQRVPLHFIASYLGVSAETLSRIRTQIH